MTGGAGFIGSVLVNRCKDKKVKKVIILDILPSGKEIFLIFQKIRN